MGNGKGQEILETAVRLFRKQGYHATSVQDIADAVGLQKGSLYHYITGKEELLARIIAEGMQGYAQVLEEIVAQPLPARERLARAVRHHVAMIAENLGIYTVFLRERHALTPEQQKLVAESMRRYQALFERTVEEGIEQGEFRAVSPRLAAMLMLGAGNWLYQWFSPEGRLSATEIAEAFLDLFLRGLERGGGGGDAASERERSG
ncbi:MAG: TetR/AcrR family transcriptional regulator [bacterium]|nr:TetR/AcrR family transcriptional regulator [bacterium]